MRQSHILRPNTMRTEFSKRFMKRYRQLRVADQKRFDQRLDLWKVDPNNKSLGVHKLKGDYAGFYSMNIGGDLRALYKVLDDGSVVLFDFIGTHSQLYG